jgi:hypothetical protein
MALTHWETTIFSIMDQVNSSLARARARAERQSLEDLHP